MQLKYHQLEKEIEERIIDDRRNHVSNIYKANDSDAIREITRRTSRQFFGRLT